jgi:predicted acyl esterase
MPHPVREEITTRDDTSFPYIFQQNVTIQLKDGSGLVRCNVYRPKDLERAPVLVTYGPYGKDIHYREYA